MPNWVTNVVKVTERIEEFKNKVLSVNDEGKEYFNFNNIIPMPKDLLIESGSDSYKYLDNHKIKKLFQGTFLNTNNTEETQEEFVNRVLLNLIKRGIPYAETEELKNRELDRIRNQAKGFYNLQKYGYEDWYAWSYDNWDTKWNACDTEIIENCTGLYIIFKTAWSCPFAIFKNLCDEFNFTVAYADEDIGSNLGIVTCKDKTLFTEELNVSSPEVNAFTSLCIGNGTVGDTDYLHELIQDYDLNISVKDFDKVTSELSCYLP